MDEIDELLGIDPNDPEQMLAAELVQQDEKLLSDLIQYRKDRGLSQHDVAERLGITRPAVSSFERHDADPRMSTIRRYALAVGATVKHEVRGPESREVLASIARPHNLHAHGGDNRDLINDIRRAPSLASSRTRKRPVAWSRA